jgi:hypothetical protein
MSATADLILERRRNRRRFAFWFMRLYQNMLRIFWVRCNVPTSQNQQYYSQYRGAALRFDRFALAPNISGPGAKQGHLYAPMVDCIVSEPTIYYK